MFEYTLDNDGVVTLTFDIRNSSVNVLNSRSIEEFAGNVSKFISDESAKGMILTSGKDVFCAGADLKELMPLSNVDKNMPLVRKLSGALRQLEKCKKPVVAAINGTALGGGYELCLACNYRVVLSDSKIRLGLPEVGLGLLPGAGGTQRLPRMIGIKNSSSYLLEGKKLNPQKALEVGFVDEVVSNSKELIAVSKKWILANTEVSQPWDQKKFKIPGGAVQSPPSFMLFTAGNALLQKKTFGNYPAPRAIMSCLYEGLQLNMDSGLEVELRYFQYLLGTPEATAMTRSLFFSLTSLNSLENRPKVESKFKCKKLGVLGAGMMGGGIAYAAASRGIQVVLKDIDQSVADQGKSYSQKVLEKRVKRGQISEDDLISTMGLISATTKAEDLKGCDLIIEAVPENRSIKEAVIKEAESMVSPGTLIASNTSTLPISGLSEFVKDPTNFIGIHFFSPVDKMPLVEIIKGNATSDMAVAHSLDFIKDLKKTPIVVNDGRGFFTSRVFTSYINEGLACLKEGISPVLVENAGRSAGMPMGPLEVADMVSIDLIYHIVKQNEEDLNGEFKSESGQVSRLFVEDLKRLGQKTKMGFYDYDESGKKIKLWKGLEDHFKPSSDQPSIEDVKERLMMVQAVDACRAFAEGVVTDPRSGDIGSIMGWGFPPYTGGVFSMINTLGTQRFVEICSSLSKKHGDAFQLPDSVLKMAEKNEGFYA